MLQMEVIGYIGGDAETRNENGIEFTVCRVAHSDRYTDANGTEHEKTQWIDLIWNGRPKVADYLKRGTQVYARGYVRLRCYSSEKARGFVAGATINVVSLELLGGNNDTVPRRLYDAAGSMVDIVKYYHCELAGARLTDGRGHNFVTDDNGWVVPVQQAPADVQDAVNGQAVDDPAEATDTQQPETNKKRK